jgi:hypothetical protein
MARLTRYWAEILLILLFFWTRVAALTLLPLHNDEAVHLNRAIQVWNLHPFYAIDDGRIAGNWAIALFYPQSAPVFAARIATVFVSMVGFASGITLGRLVTRRRSGGLLAGLLWLVCPYQFFFERLALVDIEAGAVAVLLVLVALPGLAFRHSALVTGVVLGLAFLFKVSAAPFAIVPLLGQALTRGLTWRQRFRHLIAVYLVALVIIAPAALYSAIRGNFFSIAFNNVSGVSPAARIPLNTATFVDTTVTVNGLWALVLIGIPLSLLAGRRGFYLAGSLLSQIIIMLVIGAEVLDRHLGVFMPLLPVVAAVGWSSLPTTLPIQKLSSRWALSAGVVVVSLLWAWTWTWRVAYSDPANIPMTRPMRGQYVDNYPAGYGLVEAVQALPQTVGGQRVIASMTSDGCKRALFYLPAGASLICTGQGEQSKPEIEKALRAEGMAYVLAENKPIGIDPASIGGSWKVLATYPRPGGLTQITLWRVTLEVVL